jgi:hypothetical protein
MYELYDPMTIMFFYRNKHMMCDFGTGNNNKLNWVLEDKQELIDIIETIYKGAKKGRGLVVSPKGTSNFYSGIGTSFANSWFLQITRPDTDTKQCPPRRMITLALASVCIASLRHLRRSLDLLWQQ